MRAARLAAAAVLAALCFRLGAAVGAGPPAPAPPDRVPLSPAELSWRAEGIQERMAQLEDELRQVRGLQRLTEK